MSIIKKLFGGEGVVRFDPYLGQEDLKTIGYAINKRNFDEARQLLAARNDNWLASNILTETDSVTPMESFEKWAEMEPSPTSFAFLGQSQIRHGWEIRGGARAEHVKRSAWSGFFGALEAAESTLMQGISLDPKNVEPRVPLILSARALSGDKAELQQRFEQVQALDPFRPDACEQMLQGLCDKWLGSHEEMFAFARWVEANAPSDSPARTVLPLAHIERAIFDEDMPFADYLSQPNVSAEICEACSKFLAATPRQPDVTHLQTLNTYLLVLEVTDPSTARLSRELLTRIADRPTKMPWMYTNKSIAQGYVDIEGLSKHQANKFLGPDPNATA